MRSVRSVLMIQCARPFILIVLVVITITTWGCAGQPKQLMIKESSASFPPGSIISGKTGEAVSFETLMADLETAKIIYIGESHTNSDHHQIQLKILQAVFSRFPALIVGMEMFDHTYQPQLNEWSAGNLEETAFLQKVHWYANWRYDFGLYRDILTFIKTNHVKLVGLNLPFHIPPKIAVGGIESLSEEEKGHLPTEIDTTDAAHREYIRTIFSHHSIPGRDNFDYFYAAQCTWEDTMADTLSRNLSSGKMLVLAGNGHIIHKFGIPNRAYHRTKAEYRTVYLAEAGEALELSTADYIWVTAPSESTGFRPHPGSGAKSK
jgi:uncharacterized iron-regulated protein